MLSFDGKGSVDQFSLVSINKQNVVLETVKFAEDESGDIILRLYESQNANVSFKLDTAFNFEHAFIVDLMEENATEVTAVSTRSINLEIKPFEILTIKLTGVK